MVLIFTKTSDGRLLAYDEDGKVHFPNRGSSITEPGLYNCRVLKDKDRYAFVDGELIKTIEPSSEFIYNQIMQNINPLVAHIGSSIVIFNKNIENGILNISYFTTDGKQHAVESNAKYKIYKSVLEIMHGFVTNTEDIGSENDIIYNALIKYSTEITDPLSAIAACIASFGAIDKSGYGPIYNFTNIFILDNKFIFLEKQIKWAFDMGDSPEDYFFIQNEDGSMVNLDQNIYMHIPLSNFKERTEITTGSVKEWMISNHIGCGIGSYGSYSKDRSPALGVKLIQINESEIEVKYLRGDKYYCATDEDKKEVEESFRHLYAFKKRIGKNISKELLKVINKLSDENILGLSL